VDIGPDQNAVFPADEIDTPDYQEIRKSVQ